jgi:hypothetical protein
MIDKGSKNGFVAAFAPNFLKLSATRIPQSIQWREQMMQHRCHNDVVVLG